jgi:phosphoribosylanthranilate isomerase
MTWVKLCGLRTGDDVATAVAVGADAVGFVIAPDSPRFVTPDAVGRLCAGVEIASYLVTQHLGVDAAFVALEQAGTTGVQPHGRHAAEVAAAALDAGLEVLFPIAVDIDTDLHAYPDGAVPLFDTASPGTGTPVDRALIEGAPRPFVLAGGLDPDNVVAAVTATGAHGVDVSSGIERESGMKDHELMRRFVEAVR